MSDNTELQVIDGTTGEMVGPMDVAPDFAISIEESQRRVQQLQKFIHSQLKIGEDYGTIPGCGTKKALFKPGAEKLNSLYGFAPLVEVTQRVEDWDNGTANYEVKVTLMNKRTGQVEAEGIGSCNSRESKYTKQPVANVANTLLKMAKKRALVDATLSATRVSGLFDAEEAVESGNGNDVALAMARYEGLRWAANALGIVRDTGAPWPGLPPTYTVPQIMRCIEAVERGIKGYKAAEAPTEPIEAEVSEAPATAPPEASNDAVEPESPNRNAAAQANLAKNKAQLDAAMGQRETPPPPKPKREPSERETATFHFRRRCEEKGLDLSDTEPARAIRYAAMSAHLAKEPPVQSMQGFTVPEIHELTAAIAINALKWEGQVAA